MEKNKRMRIILIVFQDGKEKKHISCDKNKLYITYNSEKKIYEISE